MKKISACDNRNQAGSGWLKIVILIVLFILGIITGLIFVKSLFNLC
jgi:hypothetical protein